MNLKEFWTTYFVVLIIVLGTVIWITEKPTYKNVAGSATASMLITMVVVKSLTEANKSR